MCQHRYTTNFLTISSNLNPDYRGSFTLCAMLDEQCKRLSSFLHGILLMLTHHLAAPLVVGNIRLLGGEDRGSIPRWSP